MHLTELMRISYPVTRIFGYQYSTSLDKIEIDITYDCNLKCVSCNRSCSQALSKDSITVQQIEKFIEESIEKNHKWNQIRLLGGEPYLHPDIFHILDKLIEYRGKYSPMTTIEISTNGYGELVNERIKQTRKEIKINNTYKNTPIQEHFDPFNKAPHDSFIHTFSDYRNACWITNECGLGLNMYGFYYCAVAAGIDRVFGLGLGLKSIPKIEAEISNQKKRLCQYCGHFWSRKHVSSHNRKYQEKEVTKSWKNAYSKYNKSKPTLPIY